MFHIRTGLSAVVLAGLIGAGGALAQSPASPSVPNAGPTTAAPASEPSKAAEVEKWTIEQWDAAKAKWAEEKVKWSACRQLATDQKLTGRQSWAFLYRCMT
jgi:hypothetical protein